MKNSKLVGAVLALGLALPFAVATGNAQTPQQPSAKVTAKVSNRTLIGPVSAADGTEADSGWVTILCNNIKTANMKDLFITAALEVGIETETTIPPPPEAEAEGVVGKGTLTVESVRLIKGEDVLTVD